MVVHSTRVAAEMRMLSAELGWQDSNRNAAEALGLLHDIGRFSQFDEYNTFSDTASVDHGERGWNVIRQAEWLSQTPVTERHILLDGVRYHNRRIIPAGLPIESLRFVQAIRDADKLDIFRVVLDAVESDGFRDLPNMLPDIALERSVSPQILNEVTRQRSGSLHSVRTLGDFLVMQLAWVYDVNYAHTWRCIEERGILPRILNQLDDSRAVGAFGEQARTFVREQLR